VQGSGFKVQCSGSYVKAYCVKKIINSRPKETTSVFWVQCLGFEVQDLRFKVKRLKLRRKGRV
jgi:hypothetical protein